MWNKNILAGAVLSLFSPLVIGAEASTGVTVSASINSTAVCSVQANSVLNLGEYSDGTASGGIVSYDIQCNGSTTGTVNLDTAFGFLRNPSESLAYTLNYGLFRPDGATPWSIESFSSNGVDAFNSQFYVIVPAGEITRNGGSMPNGDYNDLVTIRVEYL